jgi:glycosyltransferase involved in cell wall biosynthesis
VDEMRIAIITDAWEPQINGVVRTYQNVTKDMYGVEIIHPYSPGLKRIALPNYPEIEVVYNPWVIKQKLWVLMHENYSIHIATEGPLGLYARKILAKRNYTYTTSFHTLFPEFIQKQYGIPAKLFYPYFRWFHKKSKHVLVPTNGMKYKLENLGFRNLKVWTRGVDSKIFNPKRRQETNPYIVCVSRVSKEKGLDDFCRLKYNRKVVIGDGPYLNDLRQKYPDVEFIGKREGVELAEWIASADVFVFPSKADTFGIVILEALACGTPVAAYDEPGPRETIFNGMNGHYGNDLQKSVTICLSLNRGDVNSSSRNWTWQRATQQFLEVMK